MSHYNKLFVSFVLFFAGLFAFQLVSLPVSALELTAVDDDGKAEVLTTRDNVAAAGNQILVEQPIAGNVYLAGNQITVQNTRVRAIFAAGNSVNLNDVNVSQSAILSGNQVTVAGQINEDLIISANEVRLENAQVNQDVLIAANRVIIENSNINGDLRLSAAVVEGEDLETVVRGEIIREDSDSFIAGNFWTEEFNWAAFLVAILGFVINFGFALLLVTLVLMRTKSLHQKDISLGIHILFDWLKGFGIFVGSLVVLIVSFALSGLTLGIFPIIPFLFIFFALVLLFDFSCIFTIIYLANLVKNTFKLSLATGWLVLIVTALSVVLLLIPFVNIVFILIYLLVSFASFGYIVVSFIKATGQYLQHVNHLK